MFLVAALAYSWLATSTGLRIVRFPRALWSDLTNPRLVFAFFTLVAGTDVLGAGMHLRGFTTMALWLWLFALVLWLALIYFSFGALTLSQRRRRQSYSRRLASCHRRHRVPGDPWCTCRTFNGRRASPTPHNM